MPTLSINKLSDLTGLCRETVRKRLTRLAYVSDGKHVNAAKGYESKIALPMLYNADADGGSAPVTPQQAALQLSIARKEEIELGMEVTRRERIPLAVLCEINDEAFSNVAGLLKSHEGKPLSAELINDLFTELRGIGSKIKERAA